MILWSGTILIKCHSSPTGMMWESGFKWRMHPNGKFYAAFERKLINLAPDKAFENNGEK